MRELHSFTKDLSKQFCFASNIILTHHSLFLCQQFLRNFAVVKHINRYRFYNPTPSIGGSKFPLRCPNFHISPVCSWNKHFVDIGKYKNFLSPRCVSYLSVTLSPRFTRLSDLVRMDICPTIKFELWINTFLRSNDFLLERLVLFFVYAGQTFVNTVLRNWSYVWHWTPLN